MRIYFVEGIGKEDISVGKTLGYGEGENTLVYDQGGKKERTKVKKC